MNIPHKYLINNGLSEQKKKFYEKLTSNYKRAYGEYRKKNNPDYFHKKVINWLFSQNEETRMILCSVENKKYTNTFHEAYTYYIQHSKDVKFRIYDEEGGDVEKFRFDITNRDNNNNNFNKNDYSDFDTYKKKNEFDKIQNSFLNNIVFYQSESPLNDINNYSNYFTLNPEFLRNEEVFKNDCNELSYNNFLLSPIMTKKEVQNKTNILSFELPNWISNNNNENINMNQNTNYYNNEDIDKKNNKYFYLSQYVLSLIEQVLSIRYLLYYENKNIDEILSSTYLYDLFNKRKLILSYLNNSKIESKLFYNHFKLDDIKSIIFYDINIEQFIKEKKNYINESDYGVADGGESKIFNQILDDNVKTFAYDSEEIFENLVDKYKNDNNEFNKYVINMCIFFHIKRLYTLDDFFLRIIFEKIYEEYSKKICDDLITGDEKPKKKKKKKKKNNKDDNNKDINNKDVNNNEENQNFVINDNKDDKNKDINNKEINSNIQDVINVNNKEVHNNKVNEINNVRNNEINNKIENNSIKEEKDIINEYNIIKETNLNNGKNDNVNNKKGKNKKEKEFFLYEPIKKKDKKKANNKANKNIPNNNNQNNNNDNNKSSNVKEKIENNMNKDNNINKINLINNIKYDKENENERDNKNIIINNDNTKEYKEDLQKVQNSIQISNNISIQSHINSFTLCSSNNNSSTSSDSNNYKNNNNYAIKKSEHQDNNLFVVHQNPMIISYDKFSKLLDDINIFNKDLESLLIIIRKIKLEIKNHFESIVKKIYNKNSKIEIYGSSLYQLDIESSDLDLSISTKSKLPLNSLVTYLLNNNYNNQYLDINPIYTASIPIIKLDLDFLKLNNDKINELFQLLINNEYYKICVKNNFYNNFNIIKVDISMNSINYKQLNFIRKGNNHFPQIRPLIKILKKLLIFKKVNNSYKGGMSSYCLFLIIYSYLRMHKSFYENNNVDYNYGSLLIGFLFHYVMCIDFKFTIINPCLSNPFIISSIPIETIPTIIEPTTMKNAGKNIYKIFDVVSALKEIYRDIFIIIKDDKNDVNLIYKLFRKYLESDK